MQRRTLLQLTLGALAGLPARVRLRAQTAGIGADDETRIKAIAEAVLPQEIGAAGHAAVVGRFLKWHQDYRAGADTDHGYGFPRLRKTPAAPAARYRVQLDDLDSQARKSAASFAALPLTDRQRLVAAAIAAAKIERLPGRPDGGHVATDLMGFFFNSVEANDLCYRAAIARDTCRGLEGSDERPAPRSSDPLFARTPGGLGPAIGRDGGH